MKILKKIKAVQFFLILSLILSVIPICAKASNVNDTNQQVFKTIINKAYELRSNSIVTKAESNDLKNYYIQKSEIYKFENNRHKSFEIFFNLSNEKITDIKSTIKDFKINSATSLNANIYVYEQITYQWLDSKNNIITSELGIPHDIILENENGSWKIANDSYDESDITKVKSPDFKESNVDNEVISSQIQPKSNITPSILVTPYNVPTYNRNVAANYAESYWSSYNTNYFNYNSSGGDCANFASQSVYAGGGYFVGAYTDSSSNWWYNPNGSTATAKSATTWRYCPSQVAFMLAGWGTAVSSATSLSRGDLIYYDWTGDGVWDHVAIVTSFDSSLNPLVSAHNSDHHNVGWTLGGASKYKLVHFNSNF